MARLQFSAGVSVKAPAERIFDYFADYGHVAQVLEGVSRWQPIGGRSRGKGARYSVEMSVLGFPLTSILRINRWRRPAEIGWISESGLIKQEGGFTFTQTANGTLIELRIAYEPPASILGEAVARNLEGMVRKRLDNALGRIREELES